ncbi:MAG: hypothetical protein AAF840_09090, partial [Bacteroidota bacterium]
GTAFREYSRLMRQEGKDNGMPKSSITHYLRGSEAYLGEKGKKLDGTTKRCMLFDVSRLGFTMQLSEDWSADPGPTADDEPPSTKPKPDQGTKNNNSSTGKDFDPEGKDLPF